MQRPGRLIYKDKITRKHTNKIPFSMKFSDKALRLISREIMQDSDHAAHRDDSGDKGKNTRCDARKLQESNRRSRPTARKALLLRFRNRLPR
jgi:hypothetical protein